MKGGKRAQQKLEQRLRDLEMELDAEQRRHGETQKNIRKQDRRLKELAFQADEDRKAQDRLRDANEKLQQKMKAYKRQVEETVLLPVTLRAKHSGAVYCNRSCLWRAVSVTTITRNCVHRSSPN